MRKDMIKNSYPTQTCYLPIKISIVGIELEIYQIDTKLGSCKFEI